MSGPRRISVTVDRLVVSGTNRAAAEQMGRAFSAELSRQIAAAPGEWQARSQDRMTLTLAPGGAGPGDLARAAGRQIAQAVAPPGRSRPGKGGV